MIRKRRKKKNKFNKPKFIFSLSCQNISIFKTIPRKERSSSKRRRRVNFDDGEVLRIVSIEGKVNGTIRERKRKRRKEREDSFFVGFSELGIVKVGEKIHFLSEERRGC